jgi:hypothetical protein
VQSQNLQPPGEASLREGLYKVEFHTVHGTGTGVIYATCGKVSTQRHNHDPDFKPLFGTDMITLTLRGAENGDMVDFEGTALQLPGVTFKAVVTRIGD